jgi:hypothetical protein
MIKAGKLKADTRTPQFQTTSFWAQGVTLGATYPF